MFSLFQQREVFHLCFLRQFVKRVKPHTYALKGGSNLRFFYNSVRYSEDMDLDIKDMEVFQLKEIVMGILASQTLQTVMRTFQVEQVVPPDIQRAKQTETVQRFKIHLITFAGEDLFTKIEFSKRKFRKQFKLESINPDVLRFYRQPPLIVAHYTSDLALEQKINALAGRAVTQARDVFDIDLLYTQVQKDELYKTQKSISKDILKQAEESLLGITYKQFKNTVCSYLSIEDQQFYQKKEVWEGMQTRVFEIITNLRR